MFQRLPGPLCAGIVLILFNCRENISTWKETTMTLLVKEGRDQDYPDSYHPISLLNTDYKILMAILAERISKIMGAYISDNQTGFIKNRFMKDNVRKLMNVIEKAKSDKTPTY